MPASVVAVHWQTRLNQILLGVGERAFQTILCPWYRLRPASCLNPFCRLCHNFGPRVIGITFANAFAEALDALVQVTRIQAQCMCFTARL